MYLSQKDNDDEIAFANNNDGNTIWCGSGGSFTN